jgi:hypothetical protein
MSGLPELKIGFVVAVEFLNNLEGLQVNGLFA